MTDTFKVKPKARLHVGAALNQVKLASTATTYEEFRSYVASANESLSKAMETMKPALIPPLAEAAMKSPK